MQELSIIIPHFNDVISLEKLLSSIPKKETIQIIVIDDRSSKQLKQYKQVKDRYEHVLFLQNKTSNKGAGTCRNIGIDHAKGQWLLFADADDFFVKDFYPTISKYFNSKYDVIFFRPISIERETGKQSDRHEKYELLVKNYLKYKSEKAETKLRYQYYVPWSKLIRKDFITEQNIRFEEIIASNDVMFSTKLGHLLKEFYVTEEIIYCATRSYGTLTMSSDTDIFKTRLETHINYCNYLKKTINKRKQKYLNLTGLGLILNTIRHKYGIKCTLSTYIKLKRNGIKIFDIKFFHPRFIYRKIKEFRERNKVEKKFLK